MPIDIAILAATITSTFLVPYVKKGLDKMLDSVAHSFGDTELAEAKSATQKIVDKVFALFDSEREKNALGSFKADPDETEKLIKKIILEKLGADSALAAELQTMVNTPVASSPSDRGPSISDAGLAGVLDARGQDLSYATGFTQAGLIINAPPTPRRQPNEG